MGVDAQMFVKVKGQYDPEKVKYYSYIFGSAFHNKLWLDTEPYNRPLQKIDIYEQDGDDIVPGPDEYFLEIPLISRYYGIGYERGPLFDYIAMAEFLEKLIPNSIVYYGGDSSGICAEPFDKNAREKLIQHFIEHGKEPYTRAFDKDQDGSNCPICEVQMIRNGWGPKFKAWYCNGCGWSKTEKDGKIIGEFNVNN